MNTTQRAFAEGARRIGSRIGLKRVEDAAIALYKANRAIADPQGKKYGGFHDIHTHQETRDQYLWCAAVALEADDRRRRRLAK